MDFKEKSRKFQEIMGIFLKQNWKRLLIWLLAAVVCGYCAYMTDHLAHYGLPGETTRVFFHACEHADHTCRKETEVLSPGQSMEQSFTAMGNLVGSCAEVYLEVVSPEETLDGALQIQLRSLDRDVSLATVEAEPGELSEEGLATFILPEAVITQSGQKYCLTVTNCSDTDIILRVNRSIQSGTLTRDTQTVAGSLNFGFLRTSLYVPSGLLKLMMLVTILTVLAGLALVLFGNVKEHILYLVLAAGFGIVMLFDLTPLYGFDMKFQFDSTYVLSNELLGMEGAVSAPSTVDPHQSVVHYYRRGCDDYTHYQFYSNDSVSDNYTDMAAALRNLRLDRQEDRELVLAESAQGFISGQLPIMYLPQAIGFAAARRLDLGFLPMVQCGRLAAYAVFVLLVFFAIRAMPFGKRFLLILALTPTVLVQTVSLTRDAAILGMCFFLIGKGMQVAYGERKPSVWNWMLIILVSALLAPCKSIYLPVSFFWLLAIYRRYIWNQKANWPGVVLRVVIFSVPILLVMSAFSDVSILGMLSNVFRQLALPISVQPAQPAQAAQAAQAAETVAAVQTAAPQVYTLSYVLSHFPQALMAFVNTLRQQLGSLLVNGIQLFAIDLGSSDTITVLVLLLLFIEGCHTGENRETLGRGERYFALLVFIGVFLLTTLASLQWTNTGSFTIVGMQGRYLTPVFPLLGIFLMNNRLVRIQGNTQTFVKAACCIYPAVCLMNMYLWTVLR